MQCGTSVTYSERRQFNTRRAEYVTEVSGRIVVTTDGTSPLGLHCERGAGCDVEIGF